MPRLPVLATLSLLWMPPAWAQTGDVPYVPTPEPVVAAMLDLAQVDADDYLIDLGSGDGRIVVTAAKERGTSGHGVDINPVRIAEANANAARAGVEDRVSFRQGDLFEADISRADVLTMYLLPEVNLKLRPRILSELRPGTRVVSHDFDMAEWRPDQEVEVPDDGSKVYLWIVPARVEGAWRLDTGDGQPWALDIDQSFQRISGTASRDGRTIQLGGGEVIGDEVAFDWPDGRRFIGRVAPDSRNMVGSIDGEDGQVASGDWLAVRDGGS